MVSANSGGAGKLGKKNLLETVPVMSLVSHHKFHRTNLVVANINKTRMSFFTNTDDVTTNQGFLNPSGTRTNKPSGRSEFDYSASNKV